MKEFRECPECKGEGIVWYVDALFWNGTQIDHEERCPDCDGTGEVEVELEDEKEAE